MKSTNESKVMQVLDFIKDYQRREGSSPSFRQIAKHCDIPSLQTVQRYVSILESRGSLERNEFGRISISNNLSKGSTILAPLVGQVACGNPSLAEENIEETFQLPTSIFGNKDLYGLDARGDSMIGVGIYDGDKVFYRPCSVAHNGDVVVALINDSATIKTFYKKDGQVILHPENPNYKDIIPNDLVIRGVVKFVIHSF